MANGKGELNEKQRAFVEQYLQCWNASEAARRAGYNGQSNVTGSRLLANVIIRREIEARLSEYAMGANEVLARLALMARGDITPFLTPGGLIDLTTEGAKGSLCLIKRLKVKSVRTPGKKDEEEVNTEIELHDPQSALVHLGRHLALFVDKTETSGTQTVLVDDISKLSAEERRERIAEYERRRRDRISTPVAGG